MNWCWSCLPIPVKEYGEIIPPRETTLENIGKLYTPARKYYQPRHSKPVSMHHAIYFISGCNSKYPCFLAWNLSIWLILHKAGGLKGNTLGSFVARFFACVWNIQCALGGHRFNQHIVVWLKMVRFGEQCAMFDAWLGLCMDLLCFGISWLCYWAFWTRVMCFDLVFRVQ